MRNKIQEVNFRKSLKLLHKTNSLCLRSICCNKSEVSRGAPTLGGISPAWEMLLPQLLWLCRKWILSPSLNDLVVFKVSLLLLIEVFLKFGLAPAEQTNAVCAGIRQETLSYPQCIFLSPLNIISSGMLRRFYLWHCLERRDVT